MAQRRTPLSVGTGEERPSSASTQRCAPPSRRGIEEQPSSASLISGGEARQSGMCKGGSSNGQGRWGHMFRLRERSCNQDGSYLQPGCQKYVQGATREATMEAAGRGKYRAFNLLKTLCVASDDVEKQGKRPASKGKANTEDAKKQTSAKAGKSRRKRRRKENNRHRLPAPPFPPPRRRLPLQTAREWRKRQRKRSKGKR